MFILHDISENDIVIELLKTYLKNLLSYILPMHDINYHIFDQIRTGGTFSEISA